MAGEKGRYKGCEYGYFEGEAKEFLDAVIQKGGKSDTWNKLAICHMCSLLTSSMVLRVLRDNVMIIHGPTGCANICGTVTEARYGSATQRSELSDVISFIPNFVCTGIDEKDIIFGGKKRLEKAIFEADKRFNPKLITIFTTCSTEIIGDDVEGVVEQVRDSIRAKLVVLHTHGVGSEFYGYEDTYKILIDTLVIEKRPKIKGTVNVLGEKMRTAAEINHKEIFRVLDKLGIKLNCRFVKNISVDEIENLTAAELNLISCMNAGYFTAEYLKEKFDMPFVEEDYPTGLKATKDWYSKIIRLLGIEDTEDIIEREYRGTNMRMKRAETILKGKTIACTGSQGRINRFLTFIHELEMEPVFIGIHWGLRGRGLELIEEKLKAYGYQDAHIILQPGLFDIEAAIKRFKPHMMFGDPSYGFYAFQNGVGFVHGEFAPYVGFNGTVNLANRWADSIEYPVYKFWNQYYQMPSHSGREYLELKSREG